MAGFVDQQRGDVHRAAKRPRIERWTYSGQSLLAQSSDGRDQTAEILVARNAGVLIRYVAVGVHS